MKKKLLLFIFSFIFMSTNFSIISFAKDNQKIDKDHTRSYYYFHNYYNQQHISPQPATFVINTYNIYEQLSGKALNYQYISFSKYYNLVKNRYGYIDNNKTYTFSSKVYVKRAGLRVWIEKDLYLLH